MSGTMLRLLRMAGPSRWSVLAAVGLGAATVWAGIALMAASALLISRAALRPSIADLSLLVVGVRFFGIARGILRYLERYVSHDASLRLLAQLRVWFFRAVEPLAPARLISQRSGDLLARAVADIDTLQDLYIRMLAPPAVALLTIAAVGLFLWRFDPDSALAAVGLLLFAATALPALARRAGRGPGLALIASRADLHAHLVDGLQGMAELVAFGQSERYTAQWRTTSEAMAAAKRRMAWVAGVQSALGSLTTGGAVAAVLILAIADVEVGRLDGIYLAMLALMTAAAFEAAAPLAAAFQAFEAVVTAVRRLFALADERPAVVDPPAPAPPPIPGPQGGLMLEVRHLSFAYAEGEPPALWDVTFTLPPGGRLAIVGDSGAGKSTLVNLLLRFWDYTEGEVLLDGVEARRCAQDDVRRLFTVITQPTHLFSGTLRENLLVAKPDAGDQDLAAAIERAQLRAFVEACPRGYETWIGEGGLRLSGGERQRLALARALLRDAPVVILDEPTANLDPITERALLDACLQALEGRGLLLITHRLVGLDAMDEILVFQAGRVVERGRHRDLLAAGGWYSRMVQAQEAGGREPS